MISVKELLISLCPKHLLVPLRFHYWRFRGKVESEVFLLKELVGKGKRAIDIGANLGVYTYALSQLCEVVEAFEPQPWCAETLVAYSQQSNSKINVYNAGLSASKGSLNLHIPVIQGRLMTGLASFRELEGEQKCLTVPVHRLDDYNFKDISFIKIDVEGHEDKVLKGGRETIIREKPVILVEIEQRHLGGKPMEAVFNEILGLEYEGFFLYKNKLIDLCKFSFYKYQKPFLDNIYRKVFRDKVHQQYVNNFIFKPKYSNPR